MGTTPPINFQFPSNIKGILGLKVYNGGGEEAQENTDKLFAVATLVQHSYSLPTFHTVTKKPWLFFESRKFKILFFFHLSFLAVSLLQWSFWSLNCRCIGSHHCSRSAWLLKGGEPRTVHWFWLGCGQCDSVTWRGQLWRCEEVMVTVWRSNGALIWFTFSHITGKRYVLKSKLFRVVLLYTLDLQPVPLLASSCTRELVLAGEDFSLRFAPSGLWVRDCHQHGGRKESDEVVGRVWVSN